MTLRRRLDELEARTAAVGGGVLHFDPAVESAEERVARAPPGCYFVMPTAPASVEEWEAAAVRVAGYQRRLYAEWCATNGWESGWMLGPVSSPH